MRTFIKLPIRSFASDDASPFCLSPFFQGNADFQGLLLAEHIRMPFGICAQLTESSMLRHTELDASLNRYHNSYILFTGSLDAGGDSLRRVKEGHSALLCGGLGRWSTAKWQV